jgi:hypothetical protein
MKRRNDNGEIWALVGNWYDDMETRTKAHKDQEDISLR